MRDSARTVPVASGKKIAVVSYMPETELKAGRAFARELRLVRPDARIVAKLSPATAQSQLDSIAAAVRGSDVVVLAAYVRRVEGEGRTTVPPHVAAWIDSVSAGEHAIVVSFGNPYLIRQFPRARAYLNAYSVSDVSEIAVVRALTGAAGISGLSPVSLPDIFVREMD